MVGTNSAVDVEWSLLKICCSTDFTPAHCPTVHDLISADVDWDRLFALAERHGVQPLLHKTLSSVCEFVPTTQRDILQQANIRNLHKALFLSRELIRILDCVERRDIQVLPYKGLALAETLYGDIALRQSGDIDLLIQPQALTEIREAVAGLGYVTRASIRSEHEREFIKSGYELSFDGPAGPNLLEVQWAIQPSFYTVDFEIDGVFKRAVEISVAGRKVKTPCLEDLFIILSLHAAKHVWARLIWICDLARLMNLAGINWKSIASEAAELGITRLLRVGIILAGRFTGVSIPADLEQNLLSDSHAENLAEQIESQILQGSIVDVESFSYFRLMIQLRERSTDRLRIISRLALTPGPGEWSVVRLPQSLFPVYRVVRLSRLASKLVR